MNQPFERASAVTDLLKGSRAGSAEAFEQLVPLVYDELRAIAHRQLRAERPDHTLGTTALVHEAYLRLVDQTRVDWQDRSHFFALAARVMRRVLVDYARRRGALKRGANPERISLDNAVLAADQQADLVLALDEALSRLADLDERQCRVIEYRFFAGLTEEETAQLLGVTSRTVRNDWVKARGWLYHELETQQIEGE
jgi:RNA polymerase sigma factor (TIGR02999 family)